MVYIKTSKNRYTTNHPKDQAARRMFSVAKQVHENACTKNELHNPTERNIKKCMHEITNVTGGKVGETYKADARFLGESTSLEKHRR